MLLLFIPGCQLPQIDTASPYIQQPTIITKPIVQRIIAGKSINGRHIEYTVLGKGSDVVFFLATIHGNESAGTGLLRYLEQHLIKNQMMLVGRKIVILPVANPDGMANVERFNANGVDLNRNFEASNRRNNRFNGMEPLSEPESRIIKSIIQQYKPGRIVSLHEPLACIDYDGPGILLAQRMGEVCDLPVYKLGARPGSLGAYAGQELGIPIITLELRKEDATLSTNNLWNMYGKALIAAVVYPASVR